MGCPAGQAPSPDDTPLSLPTAGRGRHKICKVDPPAGYKCTAPGGPRRPQTTFALCNPHSYNLFLVQTGAGRAGCPPLDPSLTSLVPAGQLRAEGGRAAP